MKLESENFHNFINKKLVVDWKVLKILLLHPQKIFGL